jgi:thioredoxin reductase (NADPH)
MHDCLIIGGGPAGLTAAIYLGRFRRRVLVADTRESRARWIPKSRNLPGFPGGVHGTTLLRRLAQQAGLYGVELQRAPVEELRRQGEGFCASIAGRQARARTVLLATGVAEVIPPIPGLMAAIGRGLVRVCPICDGYEAQGLRVAVLGAGDHAAAEALFLRTFAQDVSLVLTAGSDLGPDRRRALQAMDVRVLHAGLASVQVQDQAVRIATAEGETVERFDIVYCAFGIRPRTELARALGAAMDEDGRLVVGERQESSVEGLYAAGDVVRGLNQISVAEAEGAIAATAIHNRLPRNPLTAEAESRALSELARP